MAAPAHKSLKDLNGKWFMNKTLSDNPDPGLALQGIGWLVRKGVGMASVTLHVNQYEGPAKPPSTEPGPFIHYDITQTATGGIKGTVENRCIDGVGRVHEDWLFGKVNGTSRWVAAADIKDAHLASNWIEDESEQAGPNGETHLINVAESIGNGWVGTQVWGFQMIGGERRYARNVVIEKDGQRVELRLVYDWLGDA